MNAELVTQAEWVDTLAAAETAPLRVASFRISPREARAYAAFEAASAAPVRPTIDRRL